MVRYTERPFVKKGWSLPENLHTTCIARIQTFVSSRHEHQSYDVMITQNMGQRSNLGGHSRYGVKFLHLLNPIRQAEGSVSSDWR